MRKTDNKSFVGGLLLITYAAILVLLILHFDWLLQITSLCIALVSPLFCGIGIAFVLNLPMSRIESLLMKLTKSNKRQSWMRPIAIALTLVLATLLLFLLSSIIFPQVGDSVMMLVRNIPMYITNITDLINRLMADFHLEYELDLEAIFHMPVQEAVAKLVQWIQQTGPSMMNDAWNMTQSIAQTIANWFLGFMLSLYLLSGKERFLRQLRKFIVSVFPDKVHQQLFYIGAKANYIFSHFIGGQLLEACILGCLFYAMMLILRMPYALLISCTIAVTSIVPMFGAMLGMCFGFLLILAINPLQSIIFVVAFQIMQQFEGNVIYPRVVGNSVGLPGIWTLLSIVVFGGLFGLLGMLIAVPTAALLYSLASEGINDALNRRRIRVKTNAVIYDMTGKKNGR